MKRLSNAGLALLVFAFLLFGQSVFPPTGGGASKCSGLSDAGTGCTAIIANYVPTSTTVAGHALSGNVSIACADLTVPCVTSTLAPAGSDSEWQARSNGTTLQQITGTSILPQSGWTTVNSLTVNDFSNGIFGAWIKDSATQNWRFLTRSTPASTFTAIATLRIGGGTCTWNSAQDIGLYVSDGTKYEGLEMLMNASGPQYRVEKLNSTTSDAGTLAGPATQGIHPVMLTVKIVEDASNRTFYYWDNGAFSQFFQEAVGTFLTTSKVGWGGLSQVSIAQCGVNLELLYWKTSTP